MDDRTNDSDSGFEGARLPDPPGGTGTDSGSPRRPASSRSRRTLVVLGGVVTAVLLIAGVGLAAAMYALRGSGERLSTSTPATSTSSRPSTSIRRRGRSSTLSA